MTTLTNYERRPDIGVQEAVLAEMRLDGRVHANDVGVSVHHGTVTLTGTVGSYPERLAAQEAALRAIGVLDIANDLEVLPAGAAKRPDTAIAMAVRHALDWDPLVPADQIHVVVSAGWVTLEGTVGRWFEREQASADAASLVGVRGVTNAIELHLGEASSREVRDAIENALERRADRLAQRLTVAVDGGVVTLAGTVRSWHEKEAVLGAARYTGGVSGLVDRIRIDPDA